MEKASKTEEKVLGTIFKLLSYKDLKTVRLINKAWSKVAATELEKRSAPIHLDHDLRNFVKFYKLELLCKNLDLYAKIPLNVHVRNGCKSDWRILKDLATYEPWKTRVTKLVLSDFWARDLNRLLPWILGNLPNLITLNISCLNNQTRSGRWVIPENYNIPVASEKKQYSLKSLSISWTGLGEMGSNDEWKILDPEIFEQRTSLKEFHIEIREVCYHAFEFFNRIHKLESTSFTSVEHLKIGVARGYQEVNVSIIATMLVLARFVNRVNPISLDFSKTLYADFFQLCEQLNTNIEIQSLAVDDSETEDQIPTTSYVLECIRRFAIFSKLQVLQLHPEPRSLQLEDEDDESYWGSEVKYNLTSVTTLQLSFQFLEEVDDFKLELMLRNASSYLPNVQKVEFFNVYLSTRVGKLTGVFEGLKNFKQLQTISFQLVDFSGDLVRRGQKQIMRTGLQSILTRTRKRPKGIFAGLALLKGIEGSALQKFSVSARLDYDLPIRLIVFVLFAGCQPNFQVDLDLIYKDARHVKLQLSEEHFDEILIPDFCEWFLGCPKTLPRHPDLSSDLLRYLKMTNYEPIVKAGP